MTDESPTEPSVIFLEINQRPPGHGGSWGAALASGIDYPALHMLSALGAGQQFCALSQPYAKAPWWVDTEFINSPIGGTYDGGDVSHELAETHLDVMSSVHYGNCYYQREEAVSDSPARIALFVVASSSSRGQVLKISQKIREAVNVRVT
jgi:hypothetical protein